MRKNKFFTNFDKEESWLNGMAAQGYRFIRKTAFGYDFEPGQPEQAIFKIDYRTFKRQEDFEDYLALFEDSGWAHISGTKRSGYQYFKKEGRHGNADIFSDADSKAGRYKRLSEMWGMLGCSYLPLLVVFISADWISPGELLHPASLYYTPGLWELSGGAFWRAFLFETPFALFRGLLWLIIPVMTLSYLFFAIKADQQYKKTQQEKLIR